MKVQMDIDSFKMYLQNIEEYVMDNDKIVTYKWLSKSLDIHVNTAKQLLYAFAEENKGSVHVTYLLGGVLQGGNGCKIQVVRENELEKVKKSYKNLTSEHVYSVQKTKSLKDLGILYVVDSQKFDENEERRRLGAIQCSNSVIRASEEIAKLRLTARAATVTADVKQWPAGPSKKSENLINKKDEKNEIANSDKKEENNTIKKGTKSGGIAAMFAAQSNKTNKKQDVDDGKSKTPEKSTAPSKSSGGISTFFTRQAETKSKSDKKSEIDSKKLKQSNKEGDNKKIQIDIDTASKKENISSSTKENSPKEPNKKRNTSSSKNNTTSNDSKKGGKAKNRKTNVNEKMQPAKKRKRIVVASDSESDDDIFDKEEEADEEVSLYSPPPQIAPEQPESDAEDLIPPTPEASMKKGRKRVRKLKDMTYMDEDGYLLTKKEYTFESCTDSEAENEKEDDKNKPKEDGKNSPEEKRKSPKNSIKEPPAKKKSPPQKTKQASLMSFFKRSS